jgi:hypothetical protein
MRDRGASLSIAQARAALSACLLISMGVSPEDAYRREWAGEDTGECLQFLRKTRLAALVGWYASGRPDWLRQVSWRSNVIQDYDISQIRTAHLFDAATNIVQVLDKAEISCVVRKGPAVADYYPAGGCRGYGDIDLYIPPEMITNAVMALGNAGFSTRVLDRKQEVYLLLTTNVIPPLVGRDGSTEVDIARSLLMPKQETESSRALFARFFLSRIMRRGIWVLPRPYLLIDLVVNLHQTYSSLRYVYQFRFQRVHRYLDLILVAMTMSATDWSLFDDAVNETLLNESVTFSFGNALRLFSQFSTEANLRARVGVDVGCLDEVGGLELSHPYHWSWSLLDRILSNNLPLDLPLYTGPRL